MNLLWQSMKRIFRFGDFHYCVLIFLISLALYSVTLKGVYGNPDAVTIKNNLIQATKPFESSAERNRYALIMSLAQNKSFALSPYIADNIATQDSGYYKGKVYILFAPGISLMALPFYLLGHMVNLAQVGAYFFICLLASATLVFLFKICRSVFNMPVWISLIAPLVFGFGSTSWGYATTMYQHHATTFFIMSSFYAVWKFKQHKKFSWVWALIPWINYALAISVDYPNAILMLPVMVYFFFSAIQLIKKTAFLTISIRKGFLLTVIPFIILMGLHGYYNQVHFGSWKTVSGSLVDYKGVKEGNLLKKNNAQQTLTKIQNSKQPVGFFKEENVAKGLYILLVSDERGIFYYSPVLLLALVGVFFALRKISIEISILVSLVVVNIFLYSSFGDPWGGWAFGPRYLIPSMATLSLFVCFFLLRYKDSIYAKLTLLVLVIYSTAIALLGVLTTNLIPTKGEGDSLRIPHTYQWNFFYLQKGASSSFLYNNFFSHYVSLIVFYVTLYEIIFGLTVLILFVLPARKNV